MNLIETLRENKAGIFAEYLEKSKLGKQVLKDIVAASKKNVKTPQKTTIFAPSDRGVKYTRGYLREITYNQIFDVLLLNHITFRAEDLKKSGVVKMSNDHGFSYDSKTHKIDGITIVKSLEVGGVMGGVIIHFIDGVFATTAEHEKLNRL